MFQPIEASDSIKESFIDYITTTFSFADSEYAEKLRAALSQDGAVVKGPYLDVTGSYKTAETLRQLTADGTASPLFTELETVTEKERELKLDRPLYTHQIQALRKANAGKNLVVTTGTGSGKTECFLLPVIDTLLREKEAGTLNNAVRAIMIYPMNALANDQIKRLRLILKNYPDIRFGLYNGNTPHGAQEARSDFHKMNGTACQPLPNEVLSREEMQAQPPHILITNYSMLEYMMLRPKDDAVFAGAQLRYIILDEAHIYRGATGMETSLLMRRLRARISRPGSVQYILTSATLGGRDADEEITAFAKNLCGVNFSAEDIIRADEVRQELIEPEDFPMELFTRIAGNQEPLKTILDEYHADFAPDADDSEKIFMLCLHSKLFGKLREIFRKKGPETVRELCSDLRPTVPSLQANELISFIAVCVRAEKEKTSLIKAKYHLFARALEGAYITLSEPKRLFLQRKEQTDDEGDTPRAVFECAVCTDCGRLAVVGKTMGTKLQQTMQWDKKAEYYLVKQSGEENLQCEDDGTEKDEESYADENDYVICPVCGAISGEKDAHFHAPCGHDPKQYIRVTRTARPDDHSDGRKCPACGFGALRRFYLGSDAATAVLGTELYELLPETEDVTPAAFTEEKQSSIFAIPSTPKKTVKQKARQFLCFSDSRSEAALFACYMEKYYQEFLRRRGIWHIAEHLKSIGKTRLPLDSFVSELKDYFITHHTFDDWNKENNLPEKECERNAWIAVLNEMFNARRGTSLASMGLISFEYSNPEFSPDGFSEKYSLPKAQGKALLNLLVMDVVYAGAIQPTKFHLDPEDREYIFYTPKQKKVKKIKLPEDKDSGQITGWAARGRKTGYYPNGRVAKLTRALGISEEEANNILMDFWTYVFKMADYDSLVLTTDQFQICLSGDPELVFYRCQKCGKITAYNCKNQCASVKCSGELVPYNPIKALERNHYANLYRSEQMKPLYIKEHTAQLSKDQQKTYQDAFIQHKINALSCSTTFELGVDLGTLETVFLRDVPPSPANYVQRAGRAGRSTHSAAFVLTYAKLSSHDFTFYENPTAMIRGEIRAPMFDIRNRKVISRHIYAVALSGFFALNPDVYDGDNQTVFLNEGGYERFQEYLASKPQSLKQLLLNSIPDDMHEAMGIEDFSWVDGLTGEQGVLQLAVDDFRSTIKYFADCQKSYHDSGNDEEAGRFQRKLREFRCAENDDSGQKNLIDFLVRNNILPKYGFPVDTVELLTNASAYSDKNLQLSRDLQMAVAEYAPGSEVIADGKMYTSRYIRKNIANKASGPEVGHFCTCPNPDCKEPNFTKEEIPEEGRKCISCGKMISKNHWQETLEPRRGFIAESKVEDVPMRRPEREYKSEDYYIGDPSRNVIDTITFDHAGKKVQIESTSNDSLVVVVEEPGYYVCPVCGYASEDRVPKDHKNAYGFPCKNQSQAGKRYLLSHDFKTDVAKITFQTPDADDKDRMDSVLYALLEGLSRALNIERNDIKGTLFRVVWGSRMIYSVVLYDAVAGGAGLVRRIVTKDGKTFQKVLKSALELVEHCSCDTSCYKCLRNYYNQKIHDILNRKSAAAFLKQWVGEMEPAEGAVHGTPADREDSRAAVNPVERIEAVFSGEGGSSDWLEEAESDVSAGPEENGEHDIVFLKLLAQGIDAGRYEKPVVSNKLTVRNTGDTIWCDLIWPESHTVLFLRDSEVDFEKASRTDWHCFYTGADLTPEEVLAAVKKEKK